MTTKLSVECVYNAFHKMDVHDLFLSCRKGDIARVKYLVEEKEVDFGVRDSWDTTPLYYACLCGHEELVEYLLNNGARCEANTFDGERCLYGALNTDIRNLLRTYKAITTTTIIRDVYAEFLRRLLVDGLYTDVEFVVHGKRMAAHRCVLLARSSYFATMFHNRWRDRKTIPLTHLLVKSWAFEAILQYLYTGRLQCHLDQVEDITRLAKQCQLNELIKDLQENVKRVLSFESTKPGVHVTVVSVEQHSDMPFDLSMLVDAAAPQRLHCEAVTELPFPPEQPQVFSDLVFAVKGYHFHCHKAFFCSRSDYFKALLDDWSRTTVTRHDNGSPVIELYDVNVDVFGCIVEYIYQNSCQLTTVNVYDVLLSSDVYLLAGLKRLCAIKMMRYIDADNVMSLTRTARLFNLPRLEDQCCEFVASNIEKMVQEEAFVAFVREDAATIRDRESTDTIPIIDDIRFHIGSFLQTFCDMYEASKKLSLIDNFLEELGLDA